jgi:hypothetical protein
VAIALVALVAGLPAGPATEATVKRQLKIDVADTRNDSELEQAINAANFFVLRRTARGKNVTAPDPVPSGWAWPADLVQGGTLLAARLFTRRNSPDGVSNMNDLGVVYVQRNDSDIAPAVG